VSPETQQQADERDPRFAVRQLLDAGERLVARFGTRDPLEFADLAMTYTKAHNRVERVLLKIRSEPQVVAGALDQALNEGDGSYRP